MTANDPVFFIWTLSAVVGVGVLTARHGLSVFFMTLPAYVFGTIIILSALKLLP